MSFVEDPCRTIARQGLALNAVFGPVLIENIKPHHVRAYLDKRGQTAKARANREKALLSHTFNRAREWGYTEAPNPAKG